MFSKSGSLRNEHWRVCIELDDDDRALLISSKERGVGNASCCAAVRHLGSFTSRPGGSWQRFGIALEDNVIDTLAPRKCSDNRKRWSQALDHPGSVKAVGHSHNDSLRRLRMRVGLDEPHRTTIRIPVHIGIMRLLPAVKLLESMTTNSSADLKYTSKRPSMSQAFHRASILSGTS
jgi:hypothetical protein